MSIYNCKKTRPLMSKKEEGQCVWTDSKGRRCGNRKCGRFFCYQHLQTASNIESCSFDEGAFVVVAR